MNATSPLVSVVIPTFNHAVFLADALRTVIAQTYAPVEIIVVDNYSTDNTAEVIAAAKHSALKYVKFANRGIIAAARNAGIRAASGEYIAFLDADDEWFPEKLALQIPHLLVGSLAGVASDLTYTGAASYAESEFGKGEEGWHDYDYAELVRQNAVTTSSMVVRRADLERVGGFDELPAFNVIEDWELWLRLAISGRIRVLGTPLVRYRIAPMQRPRMPILENKLKLLEKHRRAGYLNEADAAAATRAVRFEMGTASFTNNPEGSRENFRLARKLGSTAAFSIAAGTAAAATFFPRPVRALAFRTLKWANRRMRFA